jgi:hypothetical protein
MAESYWQLPERLDYHDNDGYAVNAGYDPLSAFSRYHGFTVYCE